MSYQTKCYCCIYASFCKMYLGSSFDPDGSCDWEPSLYVHGSARPCPACGFKAGHNAGCEYMADLEAWEPKDGDMEEL